MATVDGIRSRSGHSRKCTGPRSPPTVAATRAGSINPANSNLHQDHVRQAMHRWMTRFEHEMRTTPVERIALRIEFAQLRQWIGHLQQGALGRASGRLKSSSGDERRYTTVEMRLESIAIDLAQHRAAASRQDEFSWPLFAPSSSRAMVRDSRSRNDASPSRAKWSLIDSPPRSFSISASEST